MNTNPPQDLDTIIEGLYRWTIDTVNQGPLRDRPILGTGKAPLLSPSEAKAALTAKFAEYSADSGVAFAIQVVDDLHINQLDGMSIDRVYKGIKNNIRDRWKGKTGNDPAPNYPVPKLYTEQEVAEREAAAVGRAMDWIIANPEAFSKAIAKKQLGEMVKLLSDTPKTTIQEVVNGTPSGQAAVQRAMERSADAMDAKTSKAEEKE